MNKIICLAIVICLIGASLVSCGSIRRGKAQLLVEVGAYQAAYNTLSKMENNEKAQEQLKSLQFVLVKREYGELVSDNARTSVYTYNKHGLLIRSESETDVFEYEYDENMRLVKTSYNGSMTDEYEYDDKGNVIKHTNWYGNSPQFGYEYAYDDQGNLIREVVLGRDSYFSVLQKSYTVDYTYDQDGKMTAKVTTNKNNYTTRTDYVYDENGKLIREETENSVVEYVYDERGNILEEKQSTYTVQYTYDQDGNLTQKISKDNVSGYEQYSFTYEYDDHGSLVRETQTSNMNGKYKGVTSYTYDEDGNLILKALSYNSNGNDYAKNFVYDKYGNLTRYTETSAGGKTYVSKMEYQLVYVPYPMHESILEIIQPEM